MIHYPPRGCLTSLKFCMHILFPSSSAALLEILKSKRSCMNIPTLSRPHFVPGPSPPVYRIARPQLQTLNSVFALSLSRARTQCLLSPSLSVLLSPSLHAREVLKNPHLHPNIASSCVTSLRGRFSAFWLEAGHLGLGAWREPWHGGRLEDGDWLSPLVSPFSPATHGDP